ncbi:Protein FAR1-RELATED SEQUENCE [Arachis hypogaea]|nr:Protein FAR1-RELATED SEQUENCE [Arachis hypogaea]
MENDGKESYKDGHQSKDLSVEYECSSNESDDMVDVTVDKAEADTISIDGFEKLITDLTIEDIWRLVFDMESQHEKDIESTLKGTIDKGHRAITQVNCKARIRLIHHYRTGKWKVSVFENEHNHSLCPPKYRHLVAMNRGLNDADKTYADNLRACGVKTCHIMGYMISQKGGYDKVGFTSKNLTTLLRLGVAK